ncbi:MAG TPA: type I-U CRISPR-associated RAMP protein Csb1/Cas7u [Solirubrobacteraceae bacterium]|jgi:CRISPR-associated protein Csb1|nr:type I-U CRISPR-associated RAMP protein Csb1/Cas7u [Solirubrobacteraceae bacterium]
MSDLLAILREGLSCTPTPNRPAGIEIRQDLRPQGDLPVAPPSYEGPLEIHPRMLDGDEVRDVIELDSVGSAANRIEEALLELYRTGRYPLPVAKTTVDPGHGLPEIEITTLEAPHRVFDAWIRLSEDSDGTKFEDSPLGHDLTLADPRRLDALLETSAHDLLLGVWDSHRKGPHGQIRLARCLTTSLIGILPPDPRPVEVRAALIARSRDGTLPSAFVQQPLAGRRDPLNLGEASELPPGHQRLSEQGLSSIPPTRKRSPKSDDLRHTVSLEQARYVGYLSFAALRRLGFSETYDDTEVRVLLAALGVYALLLRSDAGWSLRSGAEFVPVRPMQLRLARAGADAEPLEVDLVAAQTLFEEAAQRVCVQDRKVALRAGPTLDGLVQKSISASKATA